MVRKDSHLGEYCTDEENKSTHVCSGCYTKCHRLGGSNNRHLFLKVLEARESKVKIEAFFGFTASVYEVQGHRHVKSIMAHQIRP